MYKGIYIALSGALLKQAQLEVITQNIANANTVGYKKDSIAFKDYLMPQDVTGSESDGRVMSVLSEVSTDFSNGVAVRTGNPLDVTLEGDGFFALEGDRFTRRGDFKTDAEGNLITQDGLKVQGSGGSIQLPEGTVAIAADGSIEVDGVLIDTLRIVAFSDPGALTKAGNGVFTATGPGEPAGATVQQGYLETSNVSAVGEMVRMIQSLREFESYHKMIQAFDEATAKVNNEIARL